MRAIVVGGGIFGQVVGWRLAKRGVEVTVLEAIAAGSADSGSGDRSRVVRAMYGEQRFAECGSKSLGLFDEWSRDLGVPMVETTGVIYLDRDEDDAQNGAFAASVDRGMTHLAELGEPFEVMTAGAIGKRWPAIDTRGLRRGVFEPGGGFAYAARAARALAGASIDAGATHLTGRAVAIERGVGAWSVATELAGGDRARLEADAVVVAAGFAGAALVEPHLAAPLPVRRIPHFTTYWDVPEPEARGLRLGRLPVWAELGAGLYGFPDDGESGFKIALHEPRWTSDGGAEGPPEDFDALRAACSARFPALRHAKLRSVYRCAYDATPDEGFLVGPVPGAEGLWFVGGMSGHGFKHGPAIGESVAAILTGEAPVVDLATYALPS
jgi:glycine/D-amino acid oxidase-like deaminating enzyme